MTNGNRKNLVYVVDNEDMDSGVFIFSYKRRRKDYGRIWPHIIKIKRLRLMIHKTNGYELTFTWT